MTILGNVLIVVAAVAYSLLLTALFSSEGRRDGGIATFAFLVTPVFWMTLSGALSVAITRGSFEWTGISRGFQYSLVLAGLLGLGVVTFFCVAVWNEPASQMPATIRPLRTWALFILPPAALLGGLLALHPDWRLGGSDWIARSPLVLSGAISLLAGAGLLAEGAVSVADRQRQRVAALHQRDDDRNQNMLREVQEMDTVKDFGRLLQHTNRWEPQPIQDLALQKVLAHPKFTGELAARLRNEWRGEALFFVDAHDPPDPQAIAEPLREGILLMAGTVRKRMTEEERMYEDTFDSDARRILSAADRLSGRGVDFVPAIRAYRAALEISREGKLDNVRPTCRGMIDTWLAAHSRR